MPPFQNILVGVDLSHGDWLASDEDDTSSHFAHELAVELVKATGAKLHFLAALNLDGRTRRLLAESPDEGGTVLERARKALQRHVDYAGKQGAVATSSVVLGRPRTEIAAHAIANQNDLVMIGSRHHGVLSGMLLGSTSLELLRRSPCPVWIVKPSVSPTPRKIMVATNFSPVCRALVEKGAALAQTFGAELHVLHIVSTHRSQILQFSMSSEAVEAEHQEQRAEGRAGLDELLARPAVAALATPPTVHLLEGTPSTVIQEQLKKLEVDLLLMGAVAWSGVPGLLMGSTAQNLLPYMECSLLTIRPDELATG